MTSSSHPESALFYNDTDVDFSWEEALEPSSGYLYLVDQDQLTVVTFANGFFTPNLFTDWPGLPHGQSWTHVRNVTDQYVEGREYGLRQVNVNTSPP
ncbi:MAG: hypothetical protein K8R59_04070, partial [Thermoanaerobaculales bacterium]|nr:hypothetical protein [Thermoanaerobaculales bacterium]